MTKRVFSGLKRLASAKTMLLVVCVALAVVLASCGVQPAGTGSKPTSTNPNGKIAFSRLDSRDGQSDIFVVEPEGSGLRRLATKPVQDNSPAWSPDGKRLAFEASQYPAGEAPRHFYNIDIYVMNADGSGLRRITKEPTPHGYNGVMHDRMPSWSPSGKRIAFLRGRWKPYAEENVGGICTMKADGTHLRRLTDDASDEFPTWSPDGKTIAFDTGYPDQGSGGIYTVNSDGGGLKKVTDPPQGVWDGQPSWSPDGTRIAFTRASEDRTEVFVMNADGTHVRKLAGKAEGAYSPDFSPDGEEIVFAVWEGESRLYVMNANGTNVRRLTKPPDSATQDDLIDDDAPDWQSLP